MANHGPFCMGINNDKENILKSTRDKECKMVRFKVPQYIWGYFLKNFKKFDQFFEELYARLDHWYYLTFRLL